MAALRCQSLLLPTQLPEIFAYWQLHIMLPCLLVLLMCYTLLSTCLYQHMQKFSEVQPVIFSCVVITCACVHVHACAKIMQLSYVNRLYLVQKTVQSKFQQNMNQFAKKNSLCNCMFVSERGGTLAIFMYYWINSGNIHVQT